VSIADFYDGLAADYHLIYADWDAAVERQGVALDRLIRDAHTQEAIDVLDCSCGIGTQAIGLACQGYRTDTFALAPRGVAITAGCTPRASLRRRDASATLPGWRRPTG
jgi:glycine/sarcosine N-methyltransferase